MFSFDKGLVNEIKKKPCICCFSVPSFAVSIINRDLHFSDNETTLFPLCVNHRAEKLQVGIIAFCAWHPGALQMLKERGFDYLYCPAKEKSDEIFEVFF